MPKRNAVRIKVVLPISVSRNQGEDKQLAHTLDIAPYSARLGGLSLKLEPGEVIEIQRGISKGRFQVIWMGAPGSAMDGQAGVRSLETTRSIWGVNIPNEEVDKDVAVQLLRKPAAPVRTAPLPRGEKRWFERHACSGAVTVRASGGASVTNGAVTDLSLGGIYVENITPWPVNTRVTLSLRVEGAELEAKGIVRSSHPMVGMGISFRDLSPENQDKLNAVLNQLKNNSGLDDESIAALSMKDTAFSHDSDDPGLEVVSVCKSVAADFDHWKARRSASEIDELREAIEDLQKKLMPYDVTPAEFAGGVHSGRV